jgi:endonuclease YncB( thermonuclease family)
MKKISYFLTNAVKIYLLTLVLTIPFALGAKSLTGKVVKVIDGDSIVLLKNKRQYEIRLVNVDCPEYKQAYGNQARHFTANLVFGKIVRAEYESKDKYGRLLAEVFLPDGRSLNRDLVRNGYAWKYDRYSNDSTLEELEQQARKNKIGLWKDPDPTPPWEFRRKK